mmetsp:Transcript_23447/g.20385  ORF Transcript_23447/g.20385 Transcript_23447/m.20385 type:complete len:84 (+) Transcript_23447:535-786(+)
MKHAYMVGLVNKSALPGFNKSLYKDNERHASPHRNQESNNQPIIQNTSSPEKDNSPKKPLPIPEPRKHGLFSSREIFIEKKKT